MKKIRHLYFSVRDLIVNIFSGSPVMAVIAVICLLGISLICSQVYDFFRDFIGRNENEARFCTVEDEVYQNLAASGKDWYAKFPSYQPKGRFEDWLNFKTPNGGRYTVFADWYPSMALVIPSVYAPRFWMGKAGYIYTPTGQLPPLADGDQLMHLEGDTYCYVLLDPG